MIVGERKPFSEIWEMVKGFKKVLVFGCNTCMAICHAGGAKEAEVLASLIRIQANHEGVDMKVDSTVIERHCEPEFFEPLMEKVRTYDLVLSTACGVGVNFLSDKLNGELPVYPGINTSFYGAVPEEGIFVELCGGCGNCILHLTGGICPIVRCSKSLMSGPCGGTNNGKCEVSDEIDCAWTLIFGRMRALGATERLREIPPPKNWATGTHGGPRRVVIRHLASLEEQEDDKE